MELKASDLRVETFALNESNWLPRNKCCVRITHLPSGAVFESTDKHSQYANRAEAYKKLEQFLETYKPVKQGADGFTLSPSLKALLLDLGVESVNIQDNRVFGFKLKEGMGHCTFTNRELGLVIRTWKCAEAEVLNHECSDEMAEMLAEKGRVCGGGALDIYEAVIAQLKKEKGLK